MSTLDETHDPALRSWLPAANDPGADFPIQNLPFAVFRRVGCGEDFRPGVAIGDQIIDLVQAAALLSAQGPAAAALAACQASCLNPLMALGPPAWTALRRLLSRALRADAPARAALATCLVPQDQAEYALPARIGDYTDFYTSIHHATRVGRLFRPGQPLLPNYRWLPVGYHGRSSSIQLSGSAIARPHGQRLAAGADAPLLGPSQRLDYELELGAFIGPGNPPGQAIRLEAAESSVFGFTLLNDWSARDLQAWEYQPLGPFLAKNFATSIAPWVVTLDALAPFRCAWARPAQDPPPLPYLDSAQQRAQGGFDIRLEVQLQTAAMRQRGDPPTRIAATSYRHAYWTLAQMVAHHTVNGCNLRPGDLLGTGTQSGPAPGEEGCLLEASAGGTTPLKLPDGETRSFLEDGDCVILRGWCERAGAVRIGFGSLSGRIAPAHA